MTEDGKTKFDSMVGADQSGVQADENGQHEEERQMGISLANFSSRIDFDASDIVIPRIRLAQGLTAEVQDGTAKPGQWLLTGYTPLDELTVVPLMFARNRALRDDAGSVLCRSNDSLNGIGTPGGVCSQCPQNQWVDGPKGERIPPACVFSYTYICYVAEHKTMGLVEFRRTSIQAGKTLNTICAQKGIGNFAVRLKNAKQSGKRGSFYQIVVQPVAADPSVIKEARAAAGLA